MGKRDGNGAGAAAGAPGDFEVIEAPNKLLAKVGGKQGSDQLSVRRAEEVLRIIKPRYEARFESDMRALRSLFQQMQDTAEYDLPLLLAKVHELRGEAGTFGYNLVAEIGRLLIEFIAAADPVGPTEQAAIAAHLQAMQAVVADKVKGEGPQVARQIVAGLNALIGKSQTPA